MIYFLLNAERTKFRAKTDEWWALANWNCDHVLTFVDQDATRRYIKMHGLYGSHPMSMSERDFDLGQLEVPSMNFDEMFEQVGDKAKFAAEVKALFEKHKAKNFPCIVYKTAHDQLELYFTSDPCYAEQKTGWLRLLRSNETGSVVGLKITGLLALIQPEHDPSIKYMEVPLDVAEECCVRFDALIKTQPLNVEEQRFFYWVNIHWPTLVEKYLWLSNMKG